MSSDNETHDAVQLLSDGWSPLKPYNTSHGSLHSAAREIYMPRETPAAAAAAAATTTSL